MGRQATAAVTASKVAPWPYLQVLKPQPPSDWTGAGLVASRGGQSNGTSESVL